MQRFHNWRCGLWLHYSNVRVVAERPADELGALNLDLHLRGLPILQIDTARGSYHCIESVADTYSAVALTLGREPEPVGDLAPKKRLFNHDPWHDALLSALRFVAAINGRGPE